MEIQMKKTQPKKTNKTTKKPKSKNDSIVEIDKDLMEALSIIDSINERTFINEKTLSEISKFLNVISNTMNYCLSSMHVYETYLVEMGADRNELQKEIDAVYFETYQRKQSEENEQYKKSVLSKINQRINEFQSKLNDGK